MWTLFILCAILAFTHARPQDQYDQQYNNQQYNNQQYNNQQYNNNQYRDAYITRYDSDTSGYGGYSYNVETSDGFRKEETGDLQYPGTENESLAVKGSYSYVGPDGVTYTVEYTADENGFQPAGEHIPPSAGVRKLGVPSAALASLAGGGLG